MSLKARRANLLKAAVKHDPDYWNVTKRFRVEWQVGDDGTPSSRDALLHIDEGGDGWGGDMTDFSTGLRQMKDGAWGHLVHKEKHPWGQLLDIFRVQV